MINKLMTFKRSYEVELRTQIDESGNVWFVGKDVCEMLGLTNATEAMKALDEDEVSLMTKQYLGIENEKGQQDINVINESGLYHLIFLSRKEEAKKFRKWVTSEVLPSIRKTGVYGVGWYVNPSPVIVAKQEEVRQLRLRLMVGDMKRMVADTGLSYHVVQSTDWGFAKAGLNSTKV